MTCKPARLLLATLALAAAPVFAQNLAVVNGKPIPSARADALIKQMASQGQPDSPELRNMVKDELIMREILMQEADKLGLSKGEDVRTQVELARQSIIIRALVADHVKNHPVKDSELQAEYDKLKAQAGEKEYRARHILVDEEAQAKEIISKLNSGAKFEDLAKQSKDTGSAANGGDLDWNSPSQFVQPFSDAMAALKKGQVTATPVQTQYGYHVIRLDDVRDAKFPALDEVKPQLSSQIQQKRLQEYQQSLREKAKVQ